MPINYKIGRKNFDLIGDQICRILAVEFQSQVQDYNNDVCRDVCIYRERTVPLDSTELSAINVSYANTDFDNKNQGTKSGANTYFIDVFKRAKSKKTTGGDTISHVELHQLMGVIDEILENTLYKKLGFNNGVISGSILRSIEVMYPKPDQGEALFSSFGRMSFEVRANENTSLEQTVSLDEAFTKVLMGETDKGYLYQYPEA